MNHLLKRSFVLFLSLLALASPLQAQKGEKIPMRVEKTEDQFIQELAPSNSEGTILNAIGHLEDLYKKDAAHINGIPGLKKLLTDSRSPVRRKAARVLGIVHAPMDDADLKNVCLMLKSNDPKEVVDGLKSLRGLASPQVVPEILPLLQHSQENVVRDACRTLKVIATKDVIPSIEPLLSNPNPAVRKDAVDAIALLRARP